MKVPLFATLLFLAVMACSGIPSRAQDTYFGSRSPAGAQPVVTPTEISAKDIKIVTSVWGSEHKFVEVTDRLADVLSHPDVEYEIAPEWLRVDPAPGWKKVLVTVFEVRGTRYTMGNHEGIKLSVHKFQDYVRNLEAAKTK